MNRPAIAPAGGAAVVGAAAAALVFGTALALLLVGSCKGVPTVARDGSVVTLFANPSTVPLGGTAVVTASVFEATGQPAVDGTEVLFTSSLGSLEPGRAKTRGGFVQITFRGSGQAGRATVTASSGSAAATTVILVGGSAATIVLEASPQLLPVGGGSTTLTATVRDAAAAPLGGLSVVFRTDRGTLSSGGRPIVTGADGSARDTLATTGDATVTVEVQGLPGSATPIPSPTATPASTPATPTPAPTPFSVLSAQVFIDVAGSGTTTIVLSATPASLPPGGGATQLAAAVSDQALRPIAGYPVVFTTSAGSIGVLGAVSSGADGVARNSLTTITQATVTAQGPNATASLTIPVGRPTPGTLLVDFTVTPFRIDAGTASATPVPAPECADPSGIDVTLRARVTSGGLPVRGAVVAFVAAAAADDARVVGRFCELPGDPAYVTDADGVAEVHYSLAATELSVCRNIGVPCTGSICARASPCVTPTPTPTPSPTPVPTPFPSLINDCCCGIRFTARVGSASDQAVPFTVFAEQDCQGSPPGNKLCKCDFF